MLSSVISALNQKLIDLELGIPVAWGNMSAPETPSDWLAVSFIPSDTEGLTLGDTGLEETIGLYQVDVCTPTGVGWSGLYSHADYIQRAYRIGSEIAYQGHSVFITGSSRTNARVDGGWYRLSLTIKWRSYNRRDALPGDFSYSSTTIDRLFNIVLPDIYQS